MKHSVLLITLLGFGFFAPFTCSKNKTTKEEAKQEERGNRETPAKQMALYGPTIRVVSQNKA
jgi:hypothetical protein